MVDVAKATKPLTTSQQLRKVRKPLIERKRRERINGCLNELKTLVLESLNKDEAQFSKLEKADILELALDVLKKKNTPKSSVSSDPSVIASKYTAGFSQCALEVTRCLGSIEGVDPEVRLHLTEHLANCVQKIAKSNSLAPVASPNVEEEPTEASRVSNPAFEKSPVQAQYTGQLTPPASPNNVLTVVTSPVSVYSAQPVQIVGHVVTSSPSVRLVTSSPPAPASQLQASSFPQRSNLQNLPNLPVLQQTVQKSPEQQVDTLYSPLGVTSTKLSPPDVRREHCVIKPQPVYQGIPSSQSVWRPW